MALKVCAILRKEAIISGMERAYCDHYCYVRNSKHYGGKRSAWNAPEYMFTIYIAQEIRKLANPPYVDIEDSVEGSIRDAGGPGSGNIASDARFGGKFDITLSRRNHIPHSILEVKRITSVGDKTKSDITRICRTLNRNNLIRCGFLALFVPGQSEEKTGLMDARVSDIKRSVRNEFKSYNRDRKIYCCIKRLPPDECGREYASLVFKATNS